MRLSCKRRACPVCGKIRKGRIAWRISHGIEVLGGERGGAWVVGTFDREVSKRQAVKIVIQFIKWVKRELESKCHIVAEWAKVWETHENGRLHVNIIMAPWEFIPQALLARKWHQFGGGPVLWVERVGKGIGYEAAKSRQKVSNYLAKYDQMVLYGRGVGYSKGWPKLPDRISAKRKGEIAWAFVGSFSGAGILHNHDVNLGHWREVAAGEWASADGEGCDCFEFQGPSEKELDRKTRDGRVAEVREYFRSVKKKREVSDG